MRDLLSMIFGPAEPIKIWGEGCVWCWSRLYNQNSMNQISWHECKHANSPCDGALSVSGLCCAGRGPRGCWRTPVSPWRRKWPWLLRHREEWWPTGAPWPSASSSSSTWQSSINWPWMWVLRFQQVSPFSCSYSLMHFRGKKRGMVVISRTLCGRGQLQVKGISAEFWKAILYDYLIKKYIHVACVFSWLTGSDCWRCAVRLQQCHRDLSPRNSFKCPAIPGKVLAITNNGNSAKMELNIKWIQWIWIL